MAEELEAGSVVGKVAGELGMEEAAEVASEKVATGGVQDVVEAVAVGGARSMLSEAHKYQADRSQVFESEEHPVKVDPFRDTLLRYAGYANEVGESFRPFIGELGVALSYIVASTYVMADSVYQTRQVGIEEQDKDVQVRNALMASTAFDSLVWQSFASVIIPGFTINRVVAASQFTLDQVGTTGLVRRWLPTILGLSAIPFIVHPIDELVHKVLDNTTRPIAKQLVGRVKDNVQASQKSQSQPDDATQV
eukprot:CAMPEP_0184680926 /NCGR_PEP_ID=MMETSP0312-20130426/3854_1 /TAXON_ID=31354 /ORGANISM="Compsopogon coeruleus, Strain SAG 36.94" /LENGTH=249 /DNA_ID=CAMNT_0027131389 /DNA_START=27 /DNA_END=776 /DNA_ORIENTATION=+